MKFYDNDLLIFCNSCYLPLKIFIHTPLSTFLSEQISCIFVFVLKKSKIIILNDIKQILYSKHFMYVDFSNKNFPCRFSFSVIVLNTLGLFANSHYRTCTHCILLS